MNEYDLDQMGFDELSLLLREAYETVQFELANQITDEICKRLVNDWGIT